MKALLIAISFLYSMAVGAQPAATLADNGLLYLDNRDLAELRALDSAEFDPSQVYQERILLVVDFFNGLSCNYYLSKTLENTGDIPVLIVVKNIPEGQIDAFRQAFNINPAFKVTANPRYQNFLSRTFSDKDKSFVLRYYPMLRVAKYANVLDQAKLSQLLRPETGLVLLPVSCDTISLNVICNGVEDVECIGDDYFFIAQPSNQLLHIDKDRKATVIKIPDSIIENRVFEEVFKRLSPAQQKFNSYKKSMKLFEENHKLFGQPLYSFSTLQVIKDTLYSTMVFGVPYEKHPNLIWFEAIQYILAFNKEGDLLRMDTLGWRTDGKYTQRPCWGFSGTKENYTIGVDANDSLTYIKDKIIVFAETTNEKGIIKHTIPRAAFSPAWKKAKDYAILHHYLNDSIVYFEYMPYRYNLKSRELTHYPELVYFSPVLHRNIFSLAHEGTYYPVVQSASYQVLVKTRKNKVVDFKVLDWRYTYFFNRYMLSPNGFRSLEFSTDGKLLLKTYPMP